MYDLLWRLDPWILALNQCWNLVRMDVWTTIMAVSGGEHVWCCKMNMEPTVKAPCFFLGGSMFYWKPYCTTSFMNKSSLLASFSQDSCHKWWFSFGIRWTGSNDILNDWSAVCSNIRCSLFRQSFGVPTTAQRLGWGCGENGENPIRFVKSCPDSPP